MSARPRIVLIHATPIAVDPIKDAFEAMWPGAEVVNILEDSLSPDRAASGTLDGPLTDRILDLSRYAVGIGAAGVLFTCSAFGASIERAASLHSIPILKPNEAMFEAAMEKGDRIAMIATFPPARETMEDEFHDEAARVRPSAAIETFVVEPAIVALRAGDADTHNRLVAEKAAELSGFDAIMLAHFSTSRAAAAVRGASAIPVMTSPDTAVTKMRRLILGAD